MEHSGAIPLTEETHTDGVWLLLIDEIIKKPVSSKDDYTCRVALF